MPRCNRELDNEKGCLCYRPAGHAGAHQCHCEIYGTSHGMKPDKKLHGIVKVRTTLVGGLHEV